MKEYIYTKLLPIKEIGYRSTKFYKDNFYLKALKEKERKGILHTMIYDEECGQCIGSEYIKFNKNYDRIDNLRDNSHHSVGFYKRKTLNKEYKMLYIIRERMIRRKRSHG